MGSERYRYTVVYLPENLANELPFGSGKRLRVRGEMDDYAFHGAWNPAGGRWYLMVPKHVLQAGGYQVGDWLSVRFHLEDPDAVDVPQELREALDSDRKAQKAWDGLTAGKQRGMAYRVDSAKTVPTRQKRAAAVLEELRGEKDAVRPGGRR